MAQFHHQMLAGQVVAAAAVLMNDPEMTDYTFPACLPYLNMAITELNEVLIESNVALTNQISPIYKVYKGENYIIQVPIDLAEIQDVSERDSGTNNSFHSLVRKEYAESLQPSSSLQFWAWQNQRVMFNGLGANTDKEVQIKYIGMPVRVADDPDTIIGPSSAMSYLTYKTGALMSMFIGENETRAGVLNDQAEQSLERIIGISNKGRQQIMTRHRPFRASYKARGY